MIPHAVLNLIWAKLISMHKSIVMNDSVMGRYLLLSSPRPPPAPAPSHWCILKAFFYLQRRDHWRHRYRWRVQTIEQDYSFQCVENYKGRRQQERI